MEQNKGYIYIRNHTSYDAYNAYKMGKTNNIPERDTQYATSEIIRGYFEAVFEVPKEKMGIIERLLQNEFQELNIKYNGGTEFYNKKIISLIEPYLNSLGIKYKNLSKEEIDNLVRNNRIKNTLNKIKYRLLINNLKSKRTNKQISYIPRKDQTIIIEKSIIHFQQYDKGMLILMCGVGKTLISLWITQKLNSNTILIGVPNKLLLKQWEKVICKIFENIPYLIVSGGVNSENIIQFLKNKKKCIVITTYSSAHKVYTASQNIDFVFDMKILDEVHHLTSININEEEKKTYINILKIKSKKQLSLTATLKLLENKDNQREEDIIVSNDNIDYFGEIIDKKCLLWAINENIICDYVIQTIITYEEQLEKQLSKFNIIEENDKRLFLSAFSSLKSIYDKHSHHILIYSNNKDNAMKINQYIKMLLDDNYFDISDLYYSDYHSHMNSKDQKNIINNFEKSSSGIITCVYCLGEGWDFPLLDAVVFAENMTSNIRIVQSALRASRKNKEQPNKITKIILPILNKDDWLENNENTDLKKVKEIIYQIGLEDETISQKIKVFRIDIDKQKQKIKENNERDDVNEFGEYDDELTQKIRLKTVKRTALYTTYEKAKKIIADKNIKSKESYYELCEKDNRLSKEPEIVFKVKFTNWIDYLSIERIYYDLETCKNKIGKYLTLYKELKKDYLDLSIIIEKLCKIDELFPPSGLWVEYYNVKNLQDIFSITNKKKKIGAIL